MAADEALLVWARRHARPVLRFYGWTEPAATFGYAQHYEEVARLTLLRPLIRRPTGGGLVPHDADWTYSLACPPDDDWHQLRAIESYRRIHEWIQSAFALLGVGTELASQSRKEVPGQCFVGCEQDDVLWHGRKVAGAAQRRNKLGLLIQGSVQPPPLGLERPDWELAIIDVAARHWGASPIPLPLGAEFSADANRLEAEKYSKDEFNRRR